MVAARNSLPPDLSARVGEFVAARSAPTGPLHVGLSGGLDSVVLLHCLASLDCSPRLIAIHVHHGLSSQAGAWADFCADYCARLAVPLRVVPVDVARDSGLGIEAAARAARYQALAGQAGTGGVLLLAQHRDDQAETLLLNLLRGSGVHGARGMLPEREAHGLNVLRPLLGETRATIADYAAQHALRWVEDESNDNTQFARNFLRHEVLTVIRRRFPAADSALAQAAGHFAEAAGLLDELAWLDWQRVAVGEAAALPALRELSEARLKNLLRWRLRELGWQVPVRSRLDEFVRQLLSAAPDRHPELCLPAGRMRVAQRQLHWLPAE